MKTENNSALIRVHLRSSASSAFLLIEPTLSD